MSRVCVHSRLTTHRQVAGVVAVHVLDHVQGIYVRAEQCRTICIELVL